MCFIDKRSTNIDSEFNNNNKFDFGKLKLPLIIVSVLVLIIVIILLLIKFIGNKNVNYFITLLGDEYITIYQDIDYVELGYEGYDDKGNDLTDKIKIKSTVDTSVSGKYEVIYSLGNVSVTRYVTVIEKPVGATYIYLKGDLTIYLDINEEYKEPGYLVFDTVDSDLTNKVKVTNNVNVTKSGTYSIIYSVVNSSGVTSSATRTVIVMGSEISLSLNTKDYVNSSVTINVYIKDNYFNYLILPNGEKINQNTYSYKVEENGNYVFTSYNKLGSKKETSITVSNIDKIKPTGKCSGIYENEKTTINITADDNIGINKYVINGNNYTSDKITLNSKLEKANIIIYDKAGNSTDISCSIEDKSLDVKPGLYEKTYGVFKYAELIPNNPKEKMALIIYLHGTGTNIHNFSNLYSYSLPYYMKNGYMNNYQAIFIAPVCTNTTDCNYVSLANEVVKLATKVADEYKIDKNHIIITGHSKGAIATWYLASSYSDFFSAAVPISFYAQSINYNNLAKVPIKAFVGGKSDDYIYYSSMKKNVDAINSTGGKAELILIPGASHGGATEAYVIKEYDLINWMISQ